MGWFKRNLFFVIGAALGVVLLAAAGFYDYKSWQRNTAAFAHLSEVFDQMKANSIKDQNGHPIYPGDAQHNNIQAAKDEELQLREWMNQTTNYFQPIAPIPKAANGRITDASFSSALHDTLAQLQRAAEAANVALPPASSSGPFAFSFTAHVDRLKFAPASLEPLAVQLGEVKAVSEVLFAANVNALDAIQRVQASPDDVGGPPTDYLNEQPVTTDLAVLTPYQVTFRGFSPEIARVLEGFAASRHGFIVMAVSVQPASAASAVSMNGGEPAGYPPGGFGPGASPLPAPTLGRGGLQTVLNEQLLSVTLKIEVVKLNPR